MLLFCFDERKSLYKIVAIDTLLGKRSLIIKIKTRVDTNINIVIFRFNHTSFSSKKKKKKIKRQKLQNYIGKDELIS